MSTAATHLWKPSSARVLVLDSFVPVPRGTPATVPAPLSWSAKDPADVLDYQFDIKPALVANDGDGIAELDVQISPNQPGDLTLNSVSADGTKAVLWLAGGQAGTVYTVTLTIVTWNGRTLQRSVLLPVLSLSNSAPPEGALVTNSGSVLTDANGNPIIAGS
jgi:hypothetical protein